jgi:hypothetical protein
MKYLLLFLAAAAGYSAHAQSSDSKEQSRGTLVFYERFGRPITDGPCKPCYSAKLSSKPITSSLTVDYGAYIPKDGVTVAIYDTAGYLLQSNSFIPKGKESTVELSKLKAPGKFVVWVYNEDDRVLYRGTFLKQ